MPGLPRIAIVVLNWNNWEDTRECLSSMAKLTFPDVGVYVVDNGSTDDSAQRIASGFPGVRLLRLPDNRGFGGGMNAGLETALEDGYDFVLCLNNDMVVEADFLESLEAAARGDRVVPYPALFLYAPRSAIDSLGNRIDLFTGMTTMIAAGSQELPELIDADYTEVPLLSRDLVEAIGGWREDFFFYYEDADLGLRIAEAGWRLVCVPESRVYHKRGHTADRVPGIRSYYSLRNRLIVVRLHGSPWHYLTTILHVFLLTLPYFFLRPLLGKGYRHSIKQVLLGVADGLLPWRRRLSRSWKMGPPPTSEG